MRNGDIDEITHCHSGSFVISLSRQESHKPMSEAITEEILEGCRMNDRKAQRTVYEKLFPSSMRICRRYCPQQEEAMEILNSGFLKVFTQLEKYSGRGSFEGWVHRIMVNTALDHLRAEKKYQSAVIHPDIMDDIPEDETEEPGFEDVNIDTLYQLIGELPPVTRMVFNLYVFEDYPHQDIANHLGISVGTSKWHLSNARKILQQKLRGIYQNAQ